VSAAVLTDEVAPVRTGVRAALANRDFRWLMISLTTSQAGDWIYNVALLGIVYERTHSAAWLSATTAARVLPIVLLGPLGGVIAARYNGKITMIGCDLIRAMLMLCLIGITLLNLPIALVPVVAAMATTVSAPYPACAAAITLRIVDEPDRAGANAARAAVGPVCVVLGPLVGGVLVALGSNSAAFAVNALTFLASALAVTFLPRAVGRPSTVAGRPGRVLSELLDGAAALWANRPVTRILGADVLCSFVYGIETVTLLVLSRQLGLGAGGYGVMLAAIGVGGVIGAVGGGRLPMSAQHRTVAGGLLLVAVPVAAVGLVPNISGVLVLLAISSAGATAVEVLVETALQRSLDEAVYARAYGFAFPASIAGIAIGSAAATPLLGLFGLGGTLAVVAGVVASYAWWLSRQHCHDRV
jgi:predicted MFS family arabinose efflux permease